MGTYIGVVEYETLNKTIRERSGFSVKAWENIVRDAKKKEATRRRVATKAANDKRLTEDHYRMDAERSLDWHLHKITFRLTHTERRIIGQAFREYQESQGYWKFIDDDDLRQELQENADKSYKVLGKSGAKRYQGRSGVADSALRYSAIKLRADDTADNKHLRSFRNGTVNLKTGQLEPHRADNLLTAHIAYDYFPGLENPPDVLLEYIGSSMGFDQIDMVRAAISLMLDLSAPNKFIHVVGPSGSGKGVFAKMIQNMFDPESVRTDNDFTKLSNADQRHQYLQGCGLYVIDDFDDVIGPEITSFYTLVEQAPISGRSLFSSKSYNTPFRTRYIVCSTNAVKSRTSSSKGWGRRVFPLVTRKLSTEQDDTLIYRLGEKTGEIISWALSMDKEYRNQILHNPSKYDDRASIYMQDSELNTNSIKSFADTCLTPVEVKNTIMPQSIEYGTLYDCYRAYCSGMGLHSMNSPMFASNLKEALPDHFVPRRNTREGDEGHDPNSRRKLASKWVYLNIVIKAFEQEGNDAFSEPKKWTLIKPGMQEGNLQLFDEWAQTNRGLNKTL